MCSEGTVRGHGRGVDVPYAMGVRSGARRPTRVLDARGGCLLDFRTVGTSQGGCIDCNQTPWSASASKWQLTVPVWVTFDVGHHQLHAAQLGFKEEFVEQARVGLP